MISSLQVHSDWNQSSALSLVSCNIFSIASLSAGVALPTDSPSMSPSRTVATVSGNLRRELPYLFNYGYGDWLTRKAFLLKNARIETRPSKWAKFHDISHIKYLFR